MRSRPAADLALPTGWIVGTYISRCFITRMPFGMLDADNTKLPVYNATKH